MKNTTVCIGLWLLSPWLPAAFAQEVRREPLPAEHSLAEMVVEPGFRVSLVASEPRVIDPVEVAFDDAGRMWVVEMRDYPLPTPASPRGAIRILEDTDANGTLDAVHEFATGLDMPTGLALWRDGAVVTLAGKLMFFRDTDGDWVADEVQEWLRGFEMQNEQLRANHPRLGIDGNWYIANGLRGGKLQLGSHFAQQTDGQQQWDIGSRDIRFHASSGKVELVTGPAQFGLCFDVLGQRLFCSNRNPAVQVVFEQEDLEGNPLAGIVAPSLDVVPPGERSEVHPIADAWTTSNLHAGQYTAACGVFMQLKPIRSNKDGESWPLCVCEPTGSLVNRYAMHRDGYHYVAESDDGPHTAWVASPDAWFRPVNINLAPDGELLIVDMHRAVIEHPHWVPEELKQRPDTRWGDAAGRIYWAGPEDAPRLEDLLIELQRRPLGTREDAELLSLVGDQNAWLRETASRLLLQRALDGQLVERAEKQLLHQVRDAHLTLPGRVRCLQLACLLGADASRDDALAIATDATAPPELAMTAIRLLRTDAPSHQRLARSAVAALDRASAELEFEWLLALGAAAASGARSGVPVDLSQRIVTRIIHADDAYRLAAAGSAFRNDGGQLLLHWLQALDSIPGESEGGFALQESVAQSLMTAAQRQARPLQPALDLMQRMLRQAAQRDQPGDDRAVHAALSALRAWLEADPAYDPAWEGLWDDALHIAEAQTYSVAVRRQAIRLLAHSPRPEDGRWIVELAQTATDPELRLAAIEAWSESADPEFDAFLVSALATGSPRQQASLLRLVTAKVKRQELLLERLDSGQIEVRQIGAAGLKQLQSAARGPLRQAWERLLDASIDPDRAAALENYAACLQLDSHADRGQKVFEKHCAACHRIGTLGQQVGPDISDSRSKTPLELLTAIVDPNRAIDNNYLRFIFLMNDGSVAEGMIVDETADAITIRNQENPRLVLDRAEIAEVKATGQSLMPDGLEAQIDLQSMADLIDFIKNWRYMDGSVPVQ